MNVLMQVKKPVAFFLALLLLLTPVLMTAQDAANAAMEGKNAAERDTNKALWFGAGCLVGVIGVGAAFLYEPNPPSSALVGKSDTYVAAYSDAYTEKAQSIQQKYSLYGFAANCVLWVIYYVAVVATVSTAANS